MCKFIKAWIGVCDKPGEPMCEEHSTTLCSSCGKAATHECAETGQFVCGAPLCNDCEHTIYEDGTNGGIGFNQQEPPEGMKFHCKKTEQKYEPWYVR